MAVHPRECALHVRVVLNEKFVAGSKADELLKEEPELYIGDHSVYNDTKGEYVFIKSEVVEGSEKITGATSGMAYLDQIDLKYPVKQR